MLQVHLQTFLSILITQKCQILICDTLVANERYGIAHCNVGSNNVLIIVNDKYFQVRKSGTCYIRNWRVLAFLLASLLLKFLACVNL
jgi:hypothetical protein